MYELNVQKHCLIKQINFYKDYEISTQVQSSRKRFNILLMLFQSIATNKLWRINVTNYFTIIEDH